MASESVISYARWELYAQRNAIRPFCAYLDLYRSPSRWGHLSYFRLTSCTSSACHVVSIRRMHLQMGQVAEVTAMQVAHLNVVSDTRSAHRTSDFADFHAGRQVLFCNPVRQD